MHTGKLYTFLLKNKGLIENGPILSDAERIGRESREKPSDCSTLSDNTGAQPEQTVIFHQIDPGERFDGAEGSTLSG